MSEKDREAINELARSCGGYLEALAYLILLGKVQIIDGKIRVKL